MGKDSFRLGLATAVAALLIGATPSAAQFDLTGNWQVVLTSSSATFTFAQSGNDVTATAAGLPWQGTIDAGSGVFSIHDTDAAVAATLTCAVIDAAFVDADHFNGTFQTAPLQCSGLPPMCACGAFTSQPAFGTRCSGACPVCGNGSVEAGESCDDGNTLAGDCCSPGCQLNIAGTPCTADGNVCTADQCDGAGGCQHLDNSLPCGTTCQPASCAAASCVPDAPAAAGTPCAADVEPCTLDACDGAGQCAHGPHPSCRVAARAAIDLRADPGRSSVRWRWKDGSGQTLPADLGDPTGATAYHLCVYAGSSLLFGGHAPAGADWTAKGSGFAFKNRDSQPGGIGVLRARAAGERAALIAKGRGPLVAFNGALAQPSLTSQLLAVDAGTRCWQADFDAPLINTTTRFKAHD